MSDAPSWFQPEAAFAAIPWEEFPPQSDSPGEPLAWHKRGIPYITDATALQNLEVWIPRSAAGDSKPDATTLPTHPGKPWVVYIHGGAWRDPLVDASSFTNTVRHALSHPALPSSVSGFASINYRLSPHPNHPAHPADPSRTAKHPDHIADVLRALAYLQTRAGFTDNYLLLGHSCGATLAFQVLMRGMQVEGVRAHKPRAVAGLNGLYDLPTLIGDAGDKHAALQPVYEAFTRGAFGDDPKVWYEVSPVSVVDWADQWGRGDGKVVLVQSQEDSLVPYRQTVDMLANLRRSVGADVSELHAGGDHNDLWGVGDRLAEIVGEVVAAMQ